MAYCVPVGGFQEYATGSILIIRLTTLIVSTYGRPRGPNIYIVGFAAIGLGLIINTYR